MSVDYLPELLTFVSMVVVAVAIVAGSFALNRLEGLTYELNERLTRLEIRDHMQSETLDYRLAKLEHRPAETPGCEGEDNKQWR